MRNPRCIKSTEKPVSIKEDQNDQGMLECQDKRTSKKLSIVIKRFGGVSIAETAEQMNCSESKVKRLVAEYKKCGLEALSV